MEQEKLTIIEAARIIENDSDKKYECQAGMIIGKCEEGKLCFLNKQLEVTKEVDTIDLINDNNEWTEVDNSAPLSEVLETDKKVRFEHKILSWWTKESEIEKSSDITKNSYVDGNFLTIDDMLLILGMYLDASRLRVVLKEGKWFIED